MTDCWPLRLARRPPQGDKVAVEVGFFACNVHWGQRYSSLGRLTARWHAKKGISRRTVQHTQKGESRSRLVGRPASDRRKTQILCWNSAREVMQAQRAAAELALTANRGVGPQQ
jgi:hypothetical protein